MLAQGAVFGSEMNRGLRTALVQQGARFNRFLLLNNATRMPGSQQFRSSSTGTSRPKMRLEHLLSVKKAGKFIFPQDKTIGDAISHLVEQGLGSSLAVDAKGELSGIFTARDILRCLHAKGGSYNSSAKTPTFATGGKESVLSTKVRDIMVKKEKLIFCSPNDTVRVAREVMYKHKIRTVPVIQDGEVLGIITSKDLADSYWLLNGEEEVGGKRAFMEMSAGRKGLPEGTRIHQGSIGAAAQQAAANRINLRLSLEAAAFAMPHPYKKPDSCASGRRDYGASELCEDLSLCEDAHFVINVGSSKVSEKTKQQTYMCVADGVGSWRQWGVDPRDFSHRLVNNAKMVVESDASQRQVQEEAGGGNPFALFNSEPIHPYDVLADAWALTTAEKITGSCTFCVATLDQKLNQLTYSNLGDSGLLVVRHVDSEIAGGLTRERATPRHLRSNDLKIIFMSQQQLRSFNLPYQLGYSGIKEHSGSFETPSDANSCTYTPSPLIHFIHLQIGVPIYFCLTAINFFFFFFFFFFFYALLASIHSFSQPRLPFIPVTLS